MTNETLYPYLAALVDRLAGIDASLKTIAEYVQLLHVEKTGETVYEVQRYVVGSDSEGMACVWLYSTHPGLNFAVTRVYHDHLHKLPYPINDVGKVWDGEVAPSTDAAAKKGYFNAFPAPFSISLMPTGKMTDSGHPVRRLHRVLDGPRDADPGAEASVGFARPKPAAPAQHGNGKAQAPRPTNEPDSADGWPASDAEFDKLPPAAQEPAQAAALARRAANQAPAGNGAPLPFKDQGTAIKWAVDHFPHYQKPDGTPDYPHAVGSHAGVCKALGCNDRQVDCWGRAWFDHVSSKQ